jgi:hypothetical protein
MSTTYKAEGLAGSWIVDGGPGQVKTLAVYTPIEAGKCAAVEAVINFDWPLGGAKPNATHGTSLNGVVDASGETIRFVLIAFALDAHEKAVYIVKAVGTKVLKDKDTLSVENLIFHVYNNPESANPNTDNPDFSIPPSGTFPPVHEYRVKVMQ